MFKKIATLFNSIAETGVVPEDIQSGYLIPLCKPGKKKGIVENLRPVILLNIIRKILAITMLNRILIRIDSQIPISQSAYRKGRGTTENVFTLRLLTEKAIIEDNAEVNIRLLDMSKAFDNVNREELMNDLNKILEKDELHMLKLLITKLSLQVKNKTIIGDKFETSKGIPQGDSLSPILFIFYLAKTLSEEEDNNKINEIQIEHSYCSREFNAIEIPTHLRDHNYTIKQSIGLNIKQEFADDVTRVNRYEELADAQVNKDIQKLKKRNFIINHDKTENTRFLSIQIMTGGSVNT